MLPVFTTQQVKDGIDHSDFMLDLSDYMKKKDAATKTDLETLTSVVANKLDKQPQHKHEISDINNLQNTLERPRVEVLEVSENKNVWGYRFYVNSSGDLVILSPNDNEIASYSNSSGKWSFETDLTEINSKINSVEDIINQYVAKTDAVLKNHYDAILLLCREHGMVDGDGDGASNITPN